MFQAIRPLEAWSRVEIRRAKLNGVLLQIELVKAMPRCSVLSARAEAITVGSLLGICRPGLDVDCRAAAAVVAVEADDVGEEDRVEAGRSRLLGEVDPVVEAVEVGLLASGSRQRPWMMCDGVFITNAAKCRGRAILSRISDPVSEVLTQTLGLDGARR